MRSKSNQSRCLQIGRPGGLWARGTAALVAGVELRGGAVSEVANLGLPGVNPARVWVQGCLRDTRDAPGHSAGLGKDCNGERSYCGGSARRGSPGLRVLAIPGAALGGVWPGSEYA